MAKLEKATIDELYEISLKSASAKSKEIFIYEKNDLSAVIGMEKAEELRKVFLKNKILIKQITNIPTLPPFTENDEFTNMCMSFRYIPKGVFDIKNEILIFDNTVAIYNTDSEAELLVIENESFTKNQKQLFLNLWDQGQQPTLGFKYSPNHSFYNSIDFHINGKQVIVYPDKDAHDAYIDMSYEDLERYVEGVLKSDSEFYNDSEYLVIFIWSYEKSKMMDVWKFNSNHVDDRSGPLSEARIYREGVICSDLGLASGNTLLVLGYEERLRRQSGDVKSYLDGPAPELPMEILNGLDFFER